MLIRLGRLLGAIALCVAANLLVGSAGPVAASPSGQGSPVELVYGQTVDGLIDSAQPSVFYAFTAGAGDVVTITMVVTAGDLDPFVVLNDLDQNPLATDDNSGGDQNARLTFVIPLAGRYLIQATHAGGMVPEGGGTFSLNLTAAVEGMGPAAQFTPSPEPAIATPLPDNLTQGDSIRLERLVSGPVRGSLDRLTAVRFYWFEGQAGDQVTLTPDQMTGFQPLFALYDGGFVELARGLPGSGLRHTLPADGIFFVAVSLPDTGSVGGDYAFEAVLGAAAGGQVEIAYGDILQGAIDATTPAATYRFSGQAGETIVVTMRRTAGDLDSYLYLLDGAGQLLFEDNDSGGDGDAQIVYTLPVDGEYLITATRLGQAQGDTSGSYAIELAPGSEPAAAETEPAVPPDYADLPRLAYDETVEGEITAAKFMDVYVFLGQEGDAITVDMVSLDKEAADALDPLLVLLDDGRIPLIEHDDIVEGVERDAHIELTLPRTAYYAIVATRFDQDAGTSVGPYRLTLAGPGSAAMPAAPLAPAERAPITRLAPEPLVAGTPAQATFETGSGAALYTFSARAGTLVDLAVTTDPGLDAVLILADENLSEVLSGGMGALTGITIPKTGTYLVVLAPRFGPVNETGGGYILAMTQTGAEEAPAGAPEGPRQLVYGDVVNGAIGDDATSQIYTFTGRAGERVRITMEAVPGSSLDCYLELQDENGGVIDANDDIDPGVVRDAQIIVDLPADGLYTVIASRYVGPDAEPTAGAYRLSLEWVDPTAAKPVSTLTVPLAYGQTEVGEITDDQYLLFYVFDGTAGDVVTITVENLSGNLDAVLHLYQSVSGTWVEIASNDDSPSGGTYEPLLSGIVLPQTGKYLIAVNRYGLDRESTFGTFSITLTRDS